MVDSRLTFRRALCFICLFFLFRIFFGGQIAFADLEIETNSFKIVINDNAQWESIADKINNRELCYKETHTPFVEIVTAEGTIEATSVKKTGNKVEVEFDSSSTRLIYEVTISEDWIHFKLIEVCGYRPKKIVLFQIPVNVTKNIGSLLNIAWDDQVSICVLSTNFQSTCKGTDKSKFALLRATTQDEPGPAFEGAAVALIVCPTSKIHQVLRSVSHFFGLLLNENSEGVTSKELFGRLSYLFLFGKDVKETDAETIIEYCHKTNFKQVLLSFQSLAKSIGHIEYNTTNFPDGSESVKRFVKKLKDNGIGVGCHVYVSKIAKNDKYVTPFPDKRFWVDTETSLASDIDADDVSISVTDQLQEWPAGPDHFARTWGHILKSKGWEGGEEKHRELIIGNEIIKYKSIGPEGVYDTFFGCERGAWGTNPSAHCAKDSVLHWGVDGCINGYIIDLETDLIDEVCSRLATIINQCGFNMIYFDGGEDVPKDRFMYYASLAPFKLMTRLRERPIIHMGTVQTHRLWHSLTKGATVDNYYCRLVRAISDGVKAEELPTVKYHINESVKCVIEANKNLMTGELGWFGIHAKSRISEGLQLDEIEYLMVKSLAYDAPISLQTSVSFSKKWNSMDLHPLTPEILNIIGIYEKMRINGEVSYDITIKLRELNKDFTCVRIGDEIEFVEVRGLPNVGGTHDIRSFIGELSAGGVIATIWHYTGKSVILRIPSSIGNLQARDIWGKEIALKSKNSTIEIPVCDKRLALIVHGLSRKDFRNYLINAEIDYNPTLD